MHDLNEIFFQEMIDIAKDKNATPLPVITSQNGLALPPEKYCLSATNYQLVRKKKVCIYLAYKIVITCELFICIYRK